MTRVLIVDDERGIRRLITRNIEEHGYDIVAVDGCDAGWRSILRAPPDVVLCDDTVGGP